MDDNTQQLAQSVIRLLIYLSMISAVTERVAEGLKRFVLDPLNTKYPMTDNLRVAVIHLVAFVIATVAAMIIPPTSQMIFDDMTATAAYITVGILCGSGASVWHDLTKIVREFSTSRE